MGNNLSSREKIPIVSYKHIQRILKYPSIYQNSSHSNYVLINTIDVSKQSCLIEYTCPIEHEERIMNELLSKNRDIHVYIYGKNTCDKNVLKKLYQLQEMGFTKVYVYIGGLFEWLCLQDIYSEAYFKTIGTYTDLLDYAPDEPNINMELNTKQNSLIRYFF